ncbi:Ubiquitin-like superfamily protein [Rhynchospora pubera]|uniref:Ubiquitin-like superfamily protein n=1 Tax=Rhynchospora pubera TaxID=906938 RepID=A0AAV8CHF3_9POAL|nr:Ubiquitin-like superfamily protein [Rhynchospora pubera]
MAMYIRVKRAKTTYYIQCDPTEAVLSIKQKLHALIDELPTNQKLVLRATQAVLDDSSTLAEQGVENDAVVELSLRQGSILSPPQPSSSSLSLSLSLSHTHTHKHTHAHTQIHTPIPDCVYSFSASF